MKDVSLQLTEKIFSSYRRTEARRGTEPAVKRRQCCQEPKLADTGETGFVGPSASAVGGKAWGEGPADTWVEGGRGPCSAVGASGSAVETN